MSWPSWIRELPTIEQNIPGATGNLLQGDDGQVVFWSFDRPADVPRHRHGAQWGTVVRGRVLLTRGDDRTEMPAGASFEVAPGEYHEAHVDEGSLVIEVYQERDRHTVSGRRPPR